VGTFVILPLSNTRRRLIWDVEVLVLSGFLVVAVVSVATGRFGGMVGVLANAGALIAMGRASTRRYFTRSAS
jgi:hypothetical protein